MGSPIQVLSAGAVKTGVRAAADAYAAQAGAVVATRFATAPAIRSQVAEGAAADVVIVPPAAMSDFSRLGRIEDATRITLGRVGAGIAIREGAEAPDISSAKAIEQALHAADSIAYNKASTGIYIDSLFERLGIAQALAGKIARQRSRTTRPTMPQS